MSPWRTRSWGPSKMRNTLWPRGPADAPQHQPPAGLGGQEGSPCAAATSVRPLPAPAHLHDGIHGAGLLAEAAVDALGHVDVVTRGAAAAVGAGLSLDGDRLPRGHRHSPPGDTVRARPGGHGVRRSRRQEGRGTLAWVCSEKSWEGRGVQPLTQLCQGTAAPWLSAPQLQRFGNPLWGWGLPARPWVVWASP